MDWNYMLPSIIVSLIVSSTTFIFGLKAGKNQSDRPLLKELYRSLYSHFFELFTSIDSERPPKWSDYKKVNTQHGYRYVPLVEELFNVGKLIELGSGFSKKLLDLERNLLILSSQQYGSYQEIETHILSVLKLNIGDRLIKDQYSYTTSKNTQGKPLVPIDYSVFFSESIFNNVLRRLQNDPSLSIKLTYHTDDNKEHPIYLYIDDTGNNKEVIELLQKTYNVAKDLGCVKKIQTEKDQVLKVKSKILKRLAKKSKNPHSFVQTVFGAITDIFAS